MTATIIKNNYEREEAHAIVSSPINRTTRAPKISLMPRKDSRVSARKVNELLLDNMDTLSEMMRTYSMSSYTDDCDCESDLEDDSHRTSLIFVEKETMLEDHARKVRKGTQRIPRAPRSTSCQSLSPQNFVLRAMDKHA